MARLCHGRAPHANGDPPRASPRRLDRARPRRHPWGMALDPIRSDLIAARHGFFTRRGGASSGVFAGLNCGVGSSDQREVVALNRARVADAMGGHPLVGLHQVHSADVVAVDGPHAGAPPRADGIVTATPGLTLVVLTADCLPVLLDGGTVVGAAHAGWKGLAAGVLEATVAAMRAAGAGQVRAAIGPSISQAAYEVGPELRDAFPDAPNAFATGRGDRLHFDLPGAALARLRALEVEAAWTGHCTYADAARFYSFRRATHRGEVDYGRLAAAIAL